MGEDAVLIAYDVDSSRFDSPYERNKFYRGLFGYKQTVRRNDKVYNYDKDGLLDEIPHIKVEDSVFIVKRMHLNKVKTYFKKWSDSGKVDVQLYKIKLTDRSV